MDLEATHIPNIPIDVASLLDPGVCIAAHSDVLGDSSWESFQKLFASAADPQTQSNHARHLALTKNILYENELGCAGRRLVLAEPMWCNTLTLWLCWIRWKVAELPLVSEMLKLLANKVLDGVPQFAEQLVLAVMRCCKVRYFCTK